MFYRRFMGPCMTTLLLTGFEPFGGATLNPSAEVVRRLAADGVEPLEVASAILPVDAGIAPRQLVGMLLDLRPDFCVLLGQADGYAGIAVERVAVNLCDFSIPDNAGVQRIDEPIVPDGPAAYFATAPTRRIVQALRDAGVPGELSLSAGAYLCNMVYYTALHVCATRDLPTQCVFIHLPSLPAQANGDRRPRPTMALETMVHGLRAVTGALSTAAERFVG